MNIIIFDNVIMYDTIFIIVVFSMYLFNICFIPWIPNRLKRDSTKLNSADMLALLSFLEANQRNRYDNTNDDINSLEYQKPFYGPYGNFDGIGNDDDDDDIGEAVNNNGEWWNEWIEPSVQYYGNPHTRFEDNPRKRLTSTGNLSIFALWLIFFVYI